MTTATTRPARRSMERLWLLLGGLGLLLMAAGLLLAARSLYIVASQPAVSGAITRIDTVAPSSISQSPNNKVQFVPTIQYRVGDQSYTIQGQSASKPNTYQVGQAVAVRYNPQHPAQGQVDSFQALWLGPLALIILGVPLAYLGRSSLLPGQRKRRPHPLPAA